ncbi:isopentenyl-diphosphate Delta-isomerase [Tessaracoccus coleopterorum]|uniref:isopentenyl-diphosphate Delta-isomerase n=1 Tax=Tessaracoccus coleopterorum TaxID=2714950 RepID=UPI0018D3F744
MRPARGARRRRERGAWHRPKSTVHTDATPLHRAFSCHVRGSDGRWLLSRRAVSKLTWPGVWTNAFCGHPDLGEEPTATIARHGLAELGITVDASRLTLALPDFRYRAVDDSGVVENEICPVWILDADVAPEPNPKRSPRSVGSRPPTWTRWSTTRRS